MNKATLKKTLVAACGCGLQHDGWPCGTCFFSISPRLDNRDWQAVLYKRGDYKRESLDNLPADVELSLRRVYTLARWRIGVRP